MGGNSTTQLRLPVLLLRPGGAAQALILFLLTLVSRAPFQTKYLYHWDSVNFAFAMQEFNLALEQPQPPGYILYVYLCRVVDTYFRSPPQTMVIVSLISSALAVVALYYLGRVMFDQTVGLIAGIFLASSPLFWFYGEIALPHTLDALLVVINVYCLYRTMQGDERFLYPAAATLAVTGGIRQQTLVFLLPLLLFAVRKVSWRRLLAAAALGALICMAWFVPLIQSSGGLSSYLRITAAFANRFQSSTSIFQDGGLWGLRRNLTKITLYTLYGWSLAVLPAALSILAILKKSFWRRNWEKVTFLVLWIFPPLLYYTLVHMGQQGLVFVFLPALFLISAAGLKSLFVSRASWVKTAVGVMALTHIAVFLMAPEFPFGVEGQRLLTADTLRNSDRYYRDRLETIVEQFPPRSTMILAANWHHVEYYLPDYIVIPFELVGKWEIDAGSPKLVSAENQVFDSSAFLEKGGTDSNGMVILFDPELEAFNRTQELSKAVPLPGGGSLSYLELNPISRLVLDAHGFGLAAK